MKFQDDTRLKNLPGHSGSENSPRPVPVVGPVKPKVNYVNELLSWEQREKTMITRTNCPLNCDKLIMSIISLQFLFIFT